MALPPGAVVLGPVPAAKPLRLVIGLSARDAAGLDALLRVPSDRRPILTAAQFAARFSPTAADQEAVVAYLRAHRLRIVHTYPDRLLLDAAGSVGQITGAFGVRLVYYRDRRGRIYYANTAPPRLPTALGRLVSTVVGLRNDLPLRHAPLPRLAPAPRVDPRGRAPRIPLAPPAGYLTPAQIQTAYDFTPIYSQTLSLPNGVTTTAAITGAGVTVALYELSPFDPADIANYDAAFGISAAPPISVAVDGGATNPFTDGRGTQEAALDIELVQAVAPGAQILVYNGPASPTNNDNTGADDTYERIVDDNRAQVLSTSWGQCEPAQNAATPPDLPLLHNIFAHAVAEGMTVVAASGDTGANDCTDGGTNPSVDYPASDPYVIGVGGTTLSVDAAGNMQSETGWAGSGGGGSAFWPLPPWQAGLCLPAGAMRQTPDVALNAGTPYAIWVAGGWLPVDGTSGGPPIWAGLLALVNQARGVYLATQGALTAGAPLAGLGDIHQQLYAIGAAPGSPPAFHDVTTGPSNGVATPGPGWDAETGWGSPDAYQLLRALIAPPTSTATPAPCATATPSATGTPAPPSASTTPTTTSTPTSTATSSATTTATATATRPATATATLTPAKVLHVRAIPGRVSVGGVVVLQLNGAPGSRQPVAFELRYPDQKARMLQLITDAHGGAMLRMRVLNALPHGRSVVVWLRVTMQVNGRTLVGWASFRILPVTANRGANEHDGQADRSGALACHPAARSVGVRGLRPCGAAAGRGGL